MVDTCPLHVATAPVNWNNSDLPGWREHIPFPLVLDEMLAAGFDVTEYDAALGGDLAGISTEMRTRSMTFCGAYFWLDTLDPDAFERDLASVTARCRLLQHLGCRNLIVSDVLRPERVAYAGAVPPNGSLSLTDDGYAALAARLSQVAEMSAAYDIGVHYHNHAGSMIETPQELHDLLRHLPGSGVDLCFDTGHYAFGGGNPRQFIDDHLGRIGYLHLKDAAPDVLDSARSLHWGYLEALRHIVFPRLGEGSVGVGEIVRSLIARGYDGFVVIEQDTCEGDPTMAARANLDFVLRAFDEGGQPAPVREHV